MPANAMSLNLTIQIIKKMIDNGYYCTGSYKNRIIEEVEWSDTFLIYGYDDETNCVLAKTEPINYEIKTEQIKYEDFYNDLKSNNKDEIYLLFPKLNPDYNYDCFDVDKFSIQIKAYLNPTSPNVSINAIQIITEYINAQQNNKEQIQIILMEALLENPTLMLERLKYIFKKYELKNFQHVQKYAEFVNKVKNIIKMCREHNNNFELITVNKEMSICISELVIETFK
ncbi:MAG: hypothetical protein A2Y40_06680 [Candidatus Margulisbacteria bacterium GWF2_35_9]|nr:MAG: hypothetical protein A2Y40_06680 [Candidatus Margulisbacteria bacterium GWF2_35_9]